MEHAHVIILPLDEGVLGLEINQWQGSRPEVLGPASAGSVAASVYWNVNRSETLSLAEAGQFLVSEEPLGEPQDPRIAALMPEFESENYENYGAYCFRALERFTGIALTPEIIERAFTDGRVWTVLPPLESFGQSVDVERWFAEQEREAAIYPVGPSLITHSQATQLIALDPAVLVDLVWELVGIAAAGLGVLDDAVVTETLRQREFTTRAELVVRQAHADLNGWATRVAVLEVVRTATHPDPATAVVLVLTSARWDSSDIQRSMLRAFEARLPGAP